MTKIISSDGSNKGIVAGQSVAAYAINIDFHDKNTFSTVELVICLDEHGYASMIMPSSLCYLLDQAGKIVCVTSKTSNLQPGKLCVLLKSEEHGWVRIQATLRGVDANDCSSSKGSKGNDYDGSGSNGSNSDDNHSNASKPTKEPGCGDDDDDSTDDDNADSTDDDDDDSTDDDDD
jgi:hypothetical protein